MSQLGRSAPRPRCTEGPEFHAAIARAYAPVLYQEAVDVRWNVPTTWNGDGDENPANNLDRASRTPAASVYYSVAETPTHFYLNYMLYYPGSIPGTSSDAPLIEHDTLGIQIVARKTETDPFGSLQVWSTFHRGTLRWWAAENSFYAEGDEVGGSFNGRLPGNRIEQGRRPALFIPHNHHTPCLPTAADGRCRPAISGSNAPFNADTRGLIYRVGDIAEAPGANDDDILTYTLIPIVEDLWARRHRTTGDDAIFGSTTPYTPPDDGAERPGLNVSVPVAFVFEHTGDSNGDLPFAYRNDNDPRGQGFWFLDPAYYVTDRGVRLAGTVATDYCFHPFFNIDVRDELEGCVSSTTAPPEL